MAISRIPIWLSADTGHDDALAILLAAYSPNAELLGISTVYGNADCTHTTRNTLAILQAIGRTDVPVYKGAAKPFCRSVVFADDIHGESGLDGTTCLPQVTTHAKTDKTAIAAMYDALSATEKGTGWLVATGCLTDIALLFAVYPDLADHIAGLSIMGGAIGDGFTDAIMGTVAGHGPRIGNWTPYAEFNAYIDDHSFRSIFDNVILKPKTIMAPLDLTHQFLATPPVQEMLLQGGKSTVRKLFNEILTFFAKTYADVFGLVEGPPVHDPLAIAVILAPQHFKGMEQAYNIDVVIDGAHGSSLAIRNSGSQCGRTIATKIPGLGVRIPRSLDKPAVWQMLDECLARAEQASA